MTSSLELPVAFAGGLHDAQSQYIELHARHNVAVEAVARVASTEGQPLQNSPHDMVLYALDGVIDDPGGHDDFVHRLQVTFARAPRKPKSEDTPPEALTTAVYDTNSPSSALRKAMPYGAYVCKVALQRNIPMEYMGPNASMFYQSNKTQLAYDPEGADRRYAVDPKGGTLEVMRPLPAFSALAAQAYGNTILHTARLFAEPSTLNAYHQARGEDIANPRSAADYIPEYTAASRNVPQANQRIRDLVNAIESSKGALDGELVSQLMLDGIDHIASLALLNSGIYYEKGRADTSFKRRLQWVVDHANNFRVGLGGYIGTQSDTFKKSLGQELVPLSDIVERAQAIAADVQPPNGLLPDGNHWKIIRVL